jgi:hypothetical protein
MLGTRHRAGLGISEQADVIALVLSEETGEFAFAKNGRLSLNLSANDLREKITEAIAGPIQTKPETTVALAGSAKDYAYESREGMDR